MIPCVIRDLLLQYVEEVKKIYDKHLCKVVLYGSYARGDFRPDSDIDIMVLLDMSDSEIKNYSMEFSYMTYDFNLDHDVDIKPIAKNKEHFEKWVDSYSFYTNIQREGVTL